jgi:Fe-S cluster assembly iron-binding protein IscA
MAWRNYSAYGMSKAALAHLTRCLALELAPAIRVNGWPRGGVTSRGHVHGAPGGAARADSTEALRGARGHCRDSALPAHGPVSSPDRYCPWTGGGPWKRARLTLPAGAGGISARGVIRRQRDSRRLHGDDDPDDCPPDFGSGRCRDASTHVRLTEVAIAQVSRSSSSRASRLLLLHPRGAGGLQRLGYDLNSCASEGGRPDVEQDGVKLATDALSAKYLSGTTIDYVSGVTARLQVQQPERQVLLRLRHVVLDLIPAGFSPGSAASSAPGPLAGSRPVGAVLVEMWLEHACQFPVRAHVVALRLVPGLGPLSERHQYLLPGTNSSTSIPGRVQPGPQPRCASELLQEGARRSSASTRPGREFPRPR